MARPARCDRVRKRPTQPVSVIGAEAISFHQDFRKKTSGQLPFPGSIHSLPCGAHASGRLALLVFRAMTALLHTLTPPDAAPATPHVLGVMNFSQGGSAPWRERQPAAVRRAPAIEVPMAQLALDAPLDARQRPVWQERWLASVPVRHGRHALGAESAIAYGQVPRLLVGALHLPLPATRACAHDVAHAYRVLFDLLRDARMPNLLRVWNFIPRLNAANVDGLEVYRDFTVGRAQAFEAARLDARHMPAATAVGCLGDAIGVFFIASDQPGRNLENPRQVSAYRYPGEHGPRPPSFARATLFAARGQRWLFVSGTASIIGHATVHLGDARAQTDTALANIRLVLARAHASMAQVRAVKLYVRHARCAQALRAQCAAAFGPQAQIQTLVTDICRSNLLVEIEALAALGA